MSLENTGGCFQSSCSANSKHQTQKPFLQTCHILKNFTFFHQSMQDVRVGSKFMTIRVKSWDVSLIVWLRQTHPIRRKFGLSPYPTRVSNMIIWSWADFWTKKRMLFRKVFDSAEVSFFRSARLSRLQRCLPGRLWYCWPFIHTFKTHPKADACRSLSSIRLWR